MMCIVYCYKNFNKLNIIVRANSASVEHLLNLQFRPEGLGVVCAERSDSTNHDNRNCQVEAVVGCFFHFQIFFAPSSPERTDARRRFFFNFTYYLLIGCEFYKAFGNY